MTYQITHDQLGERLSIGTLSIPFDEHNADYMRYLLWVSEGNTPEIIEMPTVEMEQYIFNIPITTPAIYVEDIFVSSREIKKKPEEAFAEAVAESEKPHGQAKSLDLITRSQTQMIKELRRQIIELEKRLKKLEK